MKRLETTVTLIQALSDVDYTCPYCGERIIQDFEDFLDDQGLSWSEFSNWQYEPIKCPFCENEIEVSYGFDWG